MNDEHSLVVGTAVDGGGTVGLRPEKFNRHTFWCGQSGSGKTYALGVVLERLLAETALPLLILDPNADFVGLNELRPGVSDLDAQALGAADIEVLNSTRAEGTQLNVRFMDLSVASKAAVLHLDPIRDADEFNVLLNIDVQDYDYDRADFINALRSSNDPGQQHLATRIENLQVLEWNVWSLGAGSATDVIDRWPRATVMDLGGFTHPDESKVSALGVLEHLWRNREQRRPVLIVIDEAHNVCPSQPTTAVERALVSQLVQIAAEGRKFGLWLLLSSQRPTKVHQNVLSQCDNLCVMRMNAPRDLADLAEVFGFVPDDLLARCTSSTLGQALFAGGFIEAPTFVQIRERLTAEGGSDVAVPM